MPWESRAVVKIATPEELSRGTAARVRGAADLLTDGFSLDGFEKELILASLERAGGNRRPRAVQDGDDRPSGPS